MMRVVLLRHGIAQDRDEPGCPPDPERALTDEGRKKTARACLGMKAGFGIAPTRILTSTLLRARQTAYIAAETFGVAVDNIIASEALLPEAPPYALFHALFAFSTTDQEILVTGHAPHLDLALALALAGAPGSFTKLKKAGAAFIEVPALPQPHATLEWLLGPKHLARFA